MSFHPDKCNIMRVARSKNNPILFNYHLKGHQLVAADTTTYLGVDLSHDLSHIDAQYSRFGRTRLKYAADFVSWLVILRFLFRNPSMLLPFFLVLSM
jgi:hypothetical protein